MKQSIDLPYKIGTELYYANFQYMRVSLATIIKYNVTIDADDISISAKIRIKTNDYVADWDQELNAFYISDSDTLKNILMVDKKEARDMIIERVDKMSY